MAKKKKQSPMRQQIIEKKKTAFIEPTEPDANGAIGQQIRKENISSANVSSQARVDHDEETSASISRTLGESDSDTESESSSPTDSEEEGTETAAKVFDEMKHQGPDSGKKAEWVSLFRDNRSNSQGLKLKKVEPENGQKVTLKQEDTQVITERFGHSLIGYVAGKWTGKQAIVDCCNRWLGQKKVVFHNSGWIIIRFMNESERDKVLEEGPYYVFGRPFLLKPMPKFFDFNDHEVRQVPVWIQLPNLPLELWTARALSKIVSLIGVPLNSDKLTKTMERICYARVLVEIDVADEPRKEIEITCPDGSTIKQKVIYEYLPKFCTECQVIGHLNGSCPYHTNMQNSGTIMNETLKQGGKKIADSNNKGECHSAAGNGLIKGSNTRPEIGNSGVQTVENVTNKGCPLSETGRPEGNATDQHTRNEFIQVTGRKTSKHTRFSDQQLEQQQFVVENAADSIKNAETQVGNRSSSSTEGVTPQGRKCDKHAANFNEKNADSVTNADSQMGNQVKERNRNATDGSRSQGWELDDHPAKSRNNRRNSSKRFTPKRGGGVFRSEAN